MLKPILFILSFVALNSTATPLSALQFKSNRQQSSVNKQKVENTSKSKLTIRQSLIATGKNLIGTPYRWGGTTPKGFDCSGFVHYLYQQKGYQLPRSSQEQFKALTPIENPQPGDLVFFRRGGKITHVGLYIGDGKMLHSPQTGEHVRIESIQKPNWQKRYAGARRVLPLNTSYTTKQYAKNTIRSSTTETSKKTLPKNENGKFTVK
ncbi:C40 family peptidase [Suttonella ornithocola]|uniref:Gamma-D-glutamyl-L-lysine endopeptidase n=1 Tax=Suttonella ornithocola TaxID=279832 RepID=A0A380MYU4_9GAMM|nr:C40 family peptidase [Suttonella ornithocola]SUO97206.1 Gamma-D-glutamyl-L-lysine endopeptidase [Suttonella ornithocola]